MFACNSMYVVMYGCESWTIKKAECGKIDAFELWCWRRLLRVPCTARRSSQPILKEISPEYLQAGLMLKLKLQYFGHLMWRTDSLENTLSLGKIEGRRRRGQQRMRWLDGITKLDGHEFEQALGVGNGQGGLACCSPWGCKELGPTEWTELGRGQRKLLTQRSEEGRRVPLLLSLRQREELYTLSVGYYSKSKECLKVVDPLPQDTF